MLRKASRVHSSNAVIATVAFGKLVAIFVPRVGIGEILELGGVHVGAWLPQGLTSC
jgi:hypothetical protein